MRPRKHQDSAKVPGFWHAGRIAKEMRAEIVVLKDNPAQDITAFSHVLYTILLGACYTK